MKLYKKKELLKILNSLLKINDVIGKSSNQNSNEIIDVLTKCQASAIDIGNYVETYIKDSEEIITILEHYCEAVYQMSLVVNNPDFCRKYVKLIQKQLTQLISKIRVEVPSDKKEIVFFPYKVSMWDSMESIWRAASKDERCVTYVVPIPYFEYNPDQTLGEMQYEGDQYPDYVPVISWKEYDLAKNKPDIVYVHYPYEQCNLVTRIHPNYYASNLKKYTDTLVYVPYYFTEYCYPQMHLNLPIYQYVDLIVTQSNIVKKQLISTGITTKIAALGSPKLDRMFRMEQENEVLEELKEVYGRKKIVLLNTSINCLLENNELLLKKILHIMNLFQSMKDVVLVWRPHPLLETTIKSMRPNIYELYKKIKNKFINEKIGIYDSGMDLNKLVSNVDAYLGEKESSLVLLFASLGKPICIINPACEVADTQKNIAFFNFYLQEDAIYFVQADRSIICKGNMHTCKIEEVAKIRNVPMNEIRSYTEIHEYNGEVVFSPMKADKFLFMNKETSELETMDIPNAQALNFNRAIKYKQYLYFIPTQGDEIVRLDCNTKEIKTYAEPINCIREKSIAEGFFSMFAANVVGDNLYIASPISNYIVEFGLNTEETKLFFIDASNKGYWDMVYDGTDFWLNPHRGRCIVRWNKEKGVIAEYSQYPEGFVAPKDNIGCFIQIVDCQDSIMAFPKYSNMIIKIDKKTGNMTKADFDLPYEEGMRKSNDYTWDSNYYFAKKIGNKIYALSSYDHSFLEIDYNKSSCVQRHFTLSEEARKVVGSYSIPILRGTRLNNYLYRETKQFSIANFLDGLSQGNIGFNKDEKEMLLRNIENSDGTSGYRIHKYVMQEFCDE